jgi:hypothetical protein
MNFGAYRDGCKAMTHPTLERRPGNALNVEIGAPLARCLLQPPDGRGVTKDGSTYDYLRNGGSVLAYAVCERGTCPKLNKASA